MLDAKTEMFRLLEDIPMRRLVVSARAELPSIHWKTLRSSGDPLPIQLMLQVKEMPEPKLVRSSAPDVTEGS
jgi:hypothetical protein